MWRFDTRFIQSLSLSRSVPGTGDLYLSCLKPDLMVGVMNE